MKRIFFLILTTLAFFSCQPEDNPGTKSLNCYVRYDQSGKRFSAEATMSDKKAKTSVEIPGGISYQGVEMTLVPNYGMTYQYDYAAEFVPEQVFLWRDKKSQKHEFRGAIEPIKKFSLESASISKNKPHTLTWEGPALTKGETLVFMWENPESGKTATLEVATTSGNPAIDIPAEKLKELTPGDWTLYLVRKKLKKDTVDGMPVNGIFELYTSAIQVKVTE